MFGPLIQTTRILHVYPGSIALKRTLSTSKLKEYYDALNVEKTSTNKEIKASFLRLSKIYHPDNKLTGSHTKFVQLKEAYDAIKDGPPKTDHTTSGYSQEYDLSHKAYARYREQMRDYESPHDNRFGFGGPYANSPNPWEDLMRDRAYRRQQENFGSRSGGPFTNFTLLLGAMSWIVLYSCVLLFWDYNDNVKDSYIKHRNRHRNEYMAFDAYLRRKEQARVNYLHNGIEPSEDKKPEDESPVLYSAPPETHSEAVAPINQESVVSPNL